MALASVTVTLQACGWSQPPAAQLAEQAAGTFSAAAATLEAVHHSRITRQYAAASFEAYREQGTQTVMELRSLKPRNVSEESLDLANAALSTPCLDQGCDWEGQLTALCGAAHELLAAAGP
jgi:hypothetical protein